MSTPTAADPLAPSYTDAVNRKNLALLIQLRWIAICGQIATILVVHFGFQIPLPLERMGLVLLALTALNLFSHFWLQRHVQPANRTLFIALLMDVGAFTAQLYLSGGIENPFISLYLLQITLAALLLNTASSWTLVAAACVSFAGLTRFFEPLQIGSRAIAGLGLYAIGTFVSFMLVAALLAMFVARVKRNLRERDTRLSELKQQTTEEEYIVRLGLLASGAAHELGTPLASVAVILGDWRHMPEITRHPHLVQELDEMQAAVHRCKNILSGILLSAGEARGEAPAVTTLHRLLDDITHEWSAGRPAGTLQYHAGHSALGDDIPIVSDPMLRQAMVNLLDNAYEASPEWIRLNVERRADLLRFEVADLGPGFAPAILENFGKPYNSTRSRPGAGLGLFLVVNVIRKLGGGVSARNRPEGGATVTIELPLKTLRYSEGGR